MELSAGAWETSVKDEDMEVGRVTNVKSQKHITHDQWMPDAMHSLNDNRKDQFTIENNLIISSLKSKSRI